MTILVGVCCEDGVVIGADSVATSAAGQQILIKLPSNDKVVILQGPQGPVILAATGSIGLAQRSAELITGALKDNFLNRSYVQFGADVSRRVRDEFTRTQVPFHQYEGLRFGALVAAPLEKRGRLIEFGTFDFQPEAHDGKTFFASLGSGQMLADPFLVFLSRVLWNQKRPTVKLGRFGAYWALQHAITCAPGGVGHPIQMATLTQNNKGQWVAELVPEGSLQEISLHVEELEKQIGEVASANISGAKPEPLPAPPAA